MAVRDEKPGKIFYSMGEVAEMFDVKPSLIRFWEHKFDILKPNKNKKGNRLFSPADLHNMKMIYHLVKERGMTLDGAQRYLKASRHTIERNMELSEKLHSIRSLLEEVRNALGTEGGVLEEMFKEPTTKESSEVAVKPAQEHTSKRGIEEAEMLLISVDENAETLMMEAIASMDEESEAEQMVDFETEVEKDKEEEMEEEMKSEERQKPHFVEQTLFDF